MIRKKYICVFVKAADVSLLDNDGRDSPVLNSVLPNSIRKIDDSSREYPEVRDFYGRPFRPTVVLLMS